MKKYIASLALIVLTGCALLQSSSSQFQDKAGRFLSTSAATVDAALKGWGAWVAAGKATAQDEAQVKALYQQYQGYMMVATNAYALAIKLGDPSVFTTPSNNLFSARTTLTTATLKAN